MQVMKLPPWYLDFMVPEDAMHAARGKNKQKLINNLTLLYIL